MFDNPRMTQKLSELKVDDLRRQHAAARTAEPRLEIAQRIARPLRRLRSL